MNRLSLACALLVFGWLHPSPSSALLTLKVSVGIEVLSTGGLWSAGLAQAYDSRTGEVVYAFPMEGTHRIGDANGFRIINSRQWSAPYYFQQLEGTPVADHCYIASLDAKTTELPLSKYSQSGQACASSKPIDKGIDCPDVNCESPIVLDMLGNGFRFTGLERSVAFDIDGDGRRDTVSWTDPGYDEVFLALDRNGNGRIDDGTELFGDSTAQPASSSPNGYRALAVFDEDGDNAITPLDAIYGSLVLWHDTNHDGSSQPWEIQSLGPAVERISLDTVTSGRRDAHGNLLRWVSEAEIQGRRGLRCVDVLLRRGAEP